MLIETLLDVYLAEPGLPDRHDDDPHYLTWWRDQLKGTSVDALSSRQIDAALQRLLEEGRSPGAVRHYLRPFRRACAWGVTVGHLTANPCSSSIIPKDQQATICALSREEEERLCEALGEPYAAWVRFAILTGLTQSEQFRLRWTDIKLERAILTLISAVTGSPAEIALTPETVTLLRGIQVQSAGRWVFTDPRHPLRPADTHQFYTREWPRAIRKAGLDRCAWRDLRHTCGRRLAEAGWTTQSITGFLRHYGKRRVLVYQAWNPERAAATKPVSRAAQRPDVSASLKALQEALLQDRGSRLLTFGEIAQFYAVNHLRDRPSRSNFDRMYEQFWTAWTDRPCTSITKREVTAWYLGLGQTPTHANKALTFLRALYNWSMRIGILEEIYNPAVRIDRYFRPSRERYLTESEIITLRAVLPDLPPRYEAYFLTLLYTGARLSEARFMKWKELETVSTDDPSRPLHLWRKPRTKNGHSHTVPLPRQVVEAIHRLPRNQDHVFPGASGQPLSRAAVAAMWQMIRRRVRLDDVTIHDVRRTVGSYLSQRGENAQTVQQVLNHRSPQQTSVYTRMGSTTINRALQDQANWMDDLGQRSRREPDEPETTSPPSVTTHMTPVLSGENRAEEAGTLHGEEEWPG